MAVDVMTEIEIDRPVATVAAFSSDPGNAPAWYVNIQSVAWRTAPTVQVGAQVDFVAQFLGRRLAYTYEIVDWEPGARLTMRTADGPFPMETTYTWTPTRAGGTHMTLRNRGQPAGFSRVTAPLMVLAMRRANQNDLRRLKALLEAR